MAKAAIQNLNSIIVLLVVLLVSTSFGRAF